MAMGWEAVLSSTKWWVLWGLLQIISGSLGESNATVQEYSLTGKWALRNSNSSIRLYGEVPGCVHTALSSWGLIKDPYFRFNDIAYKWIAHDGWIYSKEFTLPANIRLSQKVLLICEGIDTISTITLNNIPVLKTQNMFNRYAVDITKYVSDNNYIEVRFQSAVEWAAQKSLNHSYVIPPKCPPDVQKGECHVNFIRKAQCSFSWDWGPSFPTQGIWRDIRIEAYNLVNMDYISYVTVFDNTTYQWMIIIEPVFDVIADIHLKGHVTVTVPDLLLDHSSNVILIPGQQKYEIIIQISKNASINLWWPNGYGMQSGYNISVTFTIETEYIIQKTAKV